MAIKLALAAALLAALVASTLATTYTTTVTTVAVDEEEANPFQRQCREQVEGRQFRACQRYLSQRGSPYEFIEDVVERRGGGGQGQQGSSLQECCQQLRPLDQQGCGCQAIRHAARESQRGGRGGQQGGQSQQVYQRAQQLPQLCNLREQQCQFPLVFV